MPTDIELLDGGLSGEIEPWAPDILAGIDPSTPLDPLDRLRYRQAMDKVEAYVATSRHCAIAPSSPSPGPSPPVTA